MSPKEKFDTIINEIECLVQGETDQNGDITYYENPEISDKAFAAAQCYINERDRNALFQFLVGKTVDKYITERQLMAVYKGILDEGKIDNGKGTLITGKSADSGFIRVFKSQFHVTPTEAVGQKDYSQLLPKANWDNITQHDRVYLEVEKLQDYYRLNTRECKLALEIYKTNTYGLEEVFEYVYSYVWKFADGEQDERERDRDRDIEYYLREKSVLEMFFGCQFSLDMILGVLIAQKIGMISRPFEECDKMYLEGAAFIAFDVIDDKWGEIFEQRKTVAPYEENQKFYSFYEENYQYFIENVDKRYTYFDYLHYVFLCCYANKETVLANMKTGITNYEELYSEIGYEKIWITITDNKCDPEQAWEMCCEEEEKWKKELEQWIKEEEYEEEMRGLYGEMNREEYESYQQSILEQDIYNPDFGEDGYAAWFEGDDTYDYEPDLDDLEWNENCYMDFEAEERFRDDIDIIRDEEKQFEALCEEIGIEMDKESERKKLHRYFNFDVREFLDGCVKKWNEKGCPYYTKRIDFNMILRNREDTERPFY